MKRCRWLAWILTLTLAVSLGACGGDDDDDGERPVTFAPAGAGDLANRAFVFTDLVDPGVTSTVTTGAFSGTPPTAAISVESDDGSLIGGTLALGSCVVTPTFAVIDGVVFTGAELAGLDIVPATFDPCEIGSDGSLRLTDPTVTQGGVFTSAPGTAPAVDATLSVPLSTAFEIADASAVEAVFARGETGTAVFTLYSGGVLSYALTVNNLEAADDLTIAHIHAGDVVTNGPPVITLAGAPTQPARPVNPEFAAGASALTASAALTPDEVTSLLTSADDFYVNVHSTDFPGGLVRGQIGQTIELAFNTFLSTDAERAAPVNQAHLDALAGRTETGFSHIRLLDDDTVAFKLRVNPPLAAGDALTASHIHEGASDVAGPVFIPLVADFAGALDAVGFVALNAEQAGRLLDPAVPFYVNIHSQLVASGLVRGQLRDASGNTVPTANAGPDQPSATVGTQVTLDGSASSDPDGDPLTFAWSFVTVPTGSAAALAGAATASPTFTPDVAGQYVVQLVVNDGTVGSAPDSVTVTAAGAAGPDPVNGGVLFTTTPGIGSSTCSAAACHGPDGNSGPAPNLQGFTAQQIQNNPHGVAFTAAAAADIAAFLGQTFVSLGTQVQPVFNSNCVTACHQTGGVAAFLSLATASDSFSNLVEQSATNLGPGTRVIPFDSANSILMRSLRGQVSLMPLGGPALSQGDQDTVQLWIDQGAIDN